MSKQEFAEKLYKELKQKKDIQGIVNSIKTVTINDNNVLSLQEQLEIVELIRNIHYKQTKYLFESVDAFLELVDQVEKQIKKK